MAAKRVLVSGRVQGVFFRASTARRARSLGVTGHAINLPDGRVEVLVVGPDDAVDALLEYLHEGPPGARVTGLEVEDVSAAQPQDFSVG